VDTLFIILIIVQSWFDPKPRFTLFFLSPVKILPETNFRRMTERKGGRVFLQWRAKRGCNSVVSMLHSLYIPVYLRLYCFAALVPYNVHHA
jgi:hypothetical protein